MQIDPRLLDIDQTADEREPTDVAADQMAVIVDNLITGYLRNPERTDAMLRRDGLTKTADRLVELFGPNWWERMGNGASRSS
ncbi:hypothetical protein GCM10018777_55890 [Streptomyces albogriseolus]|uniref:hypothetical protein n=1 Tax=Streptomyces TaxID=1883 RepID=UPI0016785C8E|nr:MULTISPECIES: hypothetical protein [Streptomyces]GHB15039.1 hypothetical protein GCM10010330_80730 [Streptomyces tendae]GHG32775.1 hypothetical protein GCM10018777_55890 [Streptomyces viridodiastaticus]